MVEHQREISMSYPNNEVLERATLMSLYSVLKSEKDKSIDKNISLDFYLNDSYVGFSNTNKDQFRLIKKYGVHLIHTNNIISTKQCGNNYIFETSHCLYICQGNIKKELINFESLKPTSNIEGQLPENVPTYTTSTSINVGNNKPSTNALLMCAKLSLNSVIQASKNDEPEGKPIKLDYYIDSLRKKATVAVSQDDNSDKILYKDNDNYTSKIVSIRKVDNCYICETNGSIYLCSAGITPQRLDFNQLNEEDEE